MKPDKSEKVTREEFTAWKEKHCDVLRADSWDKDWLEWILVDRRTGIEHMVYRTKASNAVTISPKRQPVGEMNSKLRLKGDEDDAGKTNGEIRKRLGKGSPGSGGGESMSSSSGTSSGEKKHGRAETQGGGCLDDGKQLGNSRDLILKNIQHMLIVSTLLQVLEIFILITKI